jgi:hypothetical protein
MIEIKTIYRPVVITQGKARPLKDQEIDTVADNHLEEAIRADAEIFGESEGYMITVKRAKKIKEEPNGTES